MDKFHKFQLKKMEENLVFNIREVQNSEALLLQPQLQLQASYNAFYKKKNDCLGLLFDSDIFADIQMCPLIFLGCVDLQKETEGTGTQTDLPDDTQQLGERQTTENVADSLETGEKISKILHLTY